MKKIFAYEINTGYGVLNSLFIATQEEVNDIIGKKFYSYEDLGKYSEFEVTIESDEIEELKSMTDRDIKELEEKYGRVILGIDIIGRVKEIE